MSMTPAQLMETYLLEVVVNGRKYGWGAVPLWSVVLISLTVTGTFLGRSAGRRLVAWRERRRA